MSEPIISAEDKKNVILVADDDFYVRNLVKLALQDQAQIVEAENGEQVLPLYTEHKPDVLLLDIHLPKKGGLEALKDVLAQYPEAYVVMLSADGVAGNVKQTGANGAKSFIVKPFTKDVLLRHISACSTIKMKKLSA